MWDTNAVGTCSGIVTENRGRVAPGAILKGCHGDRVRLCLVEVKCDEWVKNNTRPRLPFTLAEPQEKEILLRKKLHKKLQHRKLLARNGLHATNDLLSISVGFAHHGDWAFPDESSSPDGQ
ncbi:hypothetical protein AVEN_231920-1 [Araneus ventricosus]|uniref:Uncharacterized protein n=1 Tax=Araneus ventricosus TaxID=182803 RepID=A0A4Y2TK68_ARAVE|nr:hypothetical protein AVEN_167201-1 [Araneus ventricosus]GBO00972.1 hypothetical protein AVEN_231920-1 [Araneus ventricosus]